MIYIAKLYNLYLSLVCDSEERSINIAIPFPFPLPPSIPFYFLLSYFLLLTYFLIN